jgi:drug/metabolite transporter (DMT)-like permease
MNWILLTALAVLSRSFQSVTTKVLSNRAKVSPMTQAVLFTGTALLLSILISPLVGGISFSGISDLWLVTILMIVSQSFGNILFFKGLSKLEASVTAIAFSSILLWGSILSVLFLDSSFTAMQVGGILLLGIAIMLVQYQKSVRLINAPVLYIVASAILFAVFQVTSAKLAKTMPAGTYLVLSFGGATLLIGLAYVKRIRKDFHILAGQSIPITKATLLAAACSTGYFVFSYFAYRNAPDRGVVVVLLTAQVILSVLLGVILLNERERLPIKIAAGFMALIAGILIKS